MLQSTQSIRVEWCHCDPAQIIFNPHYYVWMDNGTHHLLEEAGFPFAELVRTSSFRGCVLVSSGATFKKPAFFGDTIELISEVEKFGTKSFTMKHVFRRGADELATGQEIRVWAMSDPNRPDGIAAVPVPDHVRTALSQG